jgi:uncharacterized protein (DUF2141 family)
MKKLILASLMTFLYPQEIDSVSLTVHVEGLRNQKGHVQFAIYNKGGSIPDMHYQQCFRIEIAMIADNSSSYTFGNIPKGQYAVNILHDENKNGKIDKGFILPVEGFGYSNFSHLGFLNRPNFKKSSFELKTDTTITVDINYL